NIYESDQDKSAIDSWNQRIQNVVLAPDNKNIPRVENAGKFEGNYLIMHNGLKIEPTSYYGIPILKMLIENKGVHEPEEEFVFDNVVKTIPENAVMIELGSYWAFYSMWFYKTVKNAHCYMIEPELSNLMFGKKNFKINGMVGKFYHAYISDKSFINRKGDKFIGIDNFVEDKKIEFVHILHCDIQGFEFKMLQGAIDLFQSKKVGFVFISTHSNSLHNDCLSFLRKFEFIIIAESNMDETSSFDGLIAAKAPHISGVEKVHISKKTVN
ncbi:MAG: FkbM family methyltransferase, partial [Bacteroidia bacterium]